MNDSGHTIAEPARAGRPPAVGDGATPTGTRRLIRPVLLALAGVVTALSLPPWGFWPLAPLGVAAGIVLINRDRSPTPDHGAVTKAGDQRFGRRLSSAWAFMAAYFVVSLAWMTELTAPGFLISIPIEAALMALPLALVPRTRAALILAPAALVVGEAWRWVIPFGGVPMGNLALGQVGGPLLPVARVSGSLGLIATVGLLAAVIVMLYGGDRRGGVLGIVAVAAVLGLAGLAPRGHEVGTAAMAAVQGGGPLGTHAVNSNLGTVFERQISAMSDLEPGVLAVWPESAVTVDGPFIDSPAAKVLSELAVSGRRSLVVGVTERVIGERRFRNAVVVVEPDGSIDERYDKVHLVPFGEYVPLRSVIDRFADLSLIPREAIPGEGPGIVATPVGPVGVAISFEIYFPDRVRSGVLAGARVVTNPTLASSYTTTLVPEQSLASARLRAVETGRWVVQSSTTGYSAIVDAEGSVVGRTGLEDPGVVSAEVQLREGLTWAVRLGKLPISVLAMAALGLSAARRIGETRRGRASTDTVTGGSSDTEINR